MNDRHSGPLAGENDRTADHDPAHVTPAEDDEAVGRVGGVEDETFAREDGAEARGADAPPAGSTPSAD